MVTASTRNEQSTPAHACQSPCRSPFSSLIVTKREKGKRVLVGAYGSLELADEGERITRECCLQGYRKNSSGWKKKIHSHCQSMSSAPYILAQSGFTQGWMRTFLLVQLLLAASIAIVLSLQEAWHLRTNCLQTQAAYLLIGTKEENDQAVGEDG